MVVKLRARNPFLRGRDFRTIVPGMRFFAAMGIMAGFAVAMAAGLVLTVQGNPWLLIVSLGVFGLLFARIGCMQH
jgi:hypothetical protein